MSKHMMLAIAALFAFSTAADADDWTFFRGPNQDGISAETGWNASTKPKELWRNEVGIGSSSVVVKGDRVVTNGGLYGSVAAVEEKWVVLRVADHVKVRVAKSAISGLEAQEEAGGRK